MASCFICYNNKFHFQESRNENNNNTISITIKKILELSTLLGLLLVRAKVWIKPQYMFWHEIMSCQDSNNWRPLQSVQISTLVIQLAFV
jgi:hypothetical protein